MPDHVEHRFAHGCDISLVHKKPALAVRDCLGDTGMPGADYSQPVGHGLLRRRRQAFFVACLRIGNIVLNEDTAFIQQPLLQRLGTIAMQPNSILQSAGLNELMDGGIEFTIADHVELNFRVLRRGKAERLQQVNRPLLGREAAKRKKAFCQFWTSCGNRPWDIDPAGIRMDFLFWKPNSQKTLTMEFRSRENGTRGSIDKVLRFNIRQSQPVTDVNSMALHNERNVHALQ